MTLNLIDSVKALLPKSDIENALEMVKQDEFGCGFEIICIQLFEYDVMISPDIYQKIVELGQKMEMPEEKWLFLKELIKND